MKKKKKDTQERREQDALTKLVKIKILENAKRSEHTYIRLFFVGYLPIFVIPI